MPEICRGCGGTGLDHALTPRELQLVRGIFYMRKDATTPSGVRANQVVSLEIAPVDRQNHARLSAHGPLTYILERMEHYAGLGYVEPERDPAELKAMACSWCHGTGVPQLSLATLEAVLR